MKGKTINTKSQHHKVGDELKPTAMPACERMRHIYHRSRTLDNHAETIQNILRDRFEGCNDETCADEKTVDPHSIDMALSLTEQNITALELKLARIQQYIEEKL